MAPRGGRSAREAPVNPAPSATVRIGTAPSRDLTDAALGNTPPPSYPFAIVPTTTGFSAGALQFAAVATAATRALLLERLADIVALHVADALVDGRPLDPPLDPTTLDLSDYAAEGLNPDVVYVAPAPISDASMAIARALRDEGITAAQLARRLGVARSAVSRWTDPLYFGHSTRSLRQVAAALGLRLVVAFARPADA